jgi:hypothetical protein
MWPWVSLSDPTAGADRRTQWNDAIAAYAAMPGANLTQAAADNFDARILLCTPAVGYDAGAVGAARYCVLNPNAVFSFYLHEFGHVLGFQHSIGLRNDGDGSPGHPWYGDPYDIMSFGAFGSLLTGNVGSTNYVGNPTFSTDATIAGWPINQNDLANDCKTMQGPEPARAHVHLFDAAALPAGAVLDYWLPAAGLGAPIRATLRGAALHSVNGLPSLVVLHPPGEPATGEGRLYIEYRYPMGWDRGIHSVDPTEPTDPPELSRQAVVVHSVEYSPTHSATDNHDLPYCCYAGQIIVPIEKVTDLTAHPPLRNLGSGSDVVVRVLGEDGTGVAFTVDIEIAAASTRERTAELVVDYAPSPTDAYQLLGVFAGATYDKCGDRLEYVSLPVNTPATFSVHTTGYGLGNDDPELEVPVVTWNVGGIEVIGEGSVSIYAGDGFQHTLNYAVHAHAGCLRLDDESFDALSVPVRATVASGAGQQATVLDSVYEAGGTMVVYTPESLQKIFACYVHRRIASRKSPQVHTLGELHSLPGSTVIETARLNRDRPAVRMLVAALHDQRSLPR